MPDSLVARRSKHRVKRRFCALAAVALCACLPPLPGQEGEGTAAETTQGNPCGPTRGIVAKVIDGDTVELQSGERIRYLLVDTPEVSPPADCFGPEATTFNEQLVGGAEVSLEYDAQCFDRFGRLLAYVSVDGVEVNGRLVERGYACVLHIPPNGNARVDEFTALQAGAEAEQRGMWATCTSPCD